ncbi:MAG TPA: hypothetical protein VMI32_00830 [Candidatus Solibacter sp.]|nr:hypothetical protein [Candidatus Solibacter sp.]
MTRTGLTFLAGALLATSSAGTLLARPQTSATASAGAQAELRGAVQPSGSLVNAELNSYVDSKKAKVGARVEAHTTEALTIDGKTIIPKGTKLEGHITEATARSKGDRDSTLAIQFDKAVPKKGEEIPLKAVIMAVAAPGVAQFGESAGPGSDPMAGRGASAAGGSPMGSPQPMNPATGIPGNPSAGAQDTLNLPTMGANGTPQLPANSRGVYGLKDLKLMETSSGAAQTTFLTSTGKNVRLDGGTRLLLVAQVEAGPGAVVSK